MVKTITDCKLHPEQKHFRTWITDLVDKEKILETLQEVKDPEIPTISIVDLGIVTNIKVENDFVRIILTPTFSGCPALRVIEDLVKEKIQLLGINNVEVKTNFDVQWNTDMITDTGREMLKKHGLAPPMKHNGLVQIEMLKKVECPNCGSKNTTLQTPFGSSLCRSIHYCNDCLQSFEQFKPVA